MVELWKIFNFTIFLEFNEIKYKIKYKIKNIK